MDEITVKDDHLKPEDNQEHARASEENNPANEADENADDLAYLNRDDDEESEDSSDSNDEPESEQSDKLYTQKQLERKLEKRVKKERRNIDKRIEDRVSEELAKLRSEFSGANTHQEAPVQYESQANDDGWSNLSPQEYARRVIDHERQERDRMAQEEQMSRTQQEHYNNLMKSGREKFEDFDDLMETARFTPAIAQASQLHDNADEILYYFAHNEDKTLDLAKKSPIEQAREVNRVAMRLAQRSGASKKSNAPKPGQTRQSDTTGSGQTSYVQSLKSSMSIRELANLRKG